MFDLLIVSLFITRAGAGVYRSVITLLATLIHPFGYALAAILFYGGIGIIYALYGHHGFIDIAIVTGPGRMGFQHVARNVRKEIEKRADL